ASGAAGPAIALSGAGDVTMGSSPAFDTGTGSFSLAAWVRTTTTGIAPIVGHGTDSGFALGLSGGKITARIGGGADRIEAGTIAAGVADGNWHHTAMVLDRSAQRLTVYVDGEPAPITPTAGSCGIPAGGAVDVSGCGAASGT